MTLEESYGFGWYSAIHPDDEDTVRRAWSNLGADRLEVEMRLRKYDGEYRWHLVYIQHISDLRSANDIFSLVAFLVMRRTAQIWCGSEPRPILTTARCMIFVSCDWLLTCHRASEMLKKAREVAEKAAANQALFLANMSHEVLSLRFL